MNGAQNAQTYAVPQQSSLSFTQGFLLGQLSIVLLLAAFIKFFIFGDPPPPPSPTHTHTHNRAPSLRSKPSSPRTSRPAPATILAKTYYNVHAHQPESLDWFNVLVAQTIAQFRADALADNAILTSLTALLNGPLKPEFLAAIKITEVNLGEEYPIFSNCRVHPVEEEGGGGAAGRLQAWMDVDLSDFVTLGVETTMVLNYPRPRTAVLPVALSVSVVRFSGTLSVSFVPVASPAATKDEEGDGQWGTSGGSASSTSSAHTPTTLAFSFLPNYALSLSTRSLLGSRSRLQDVPKIAQLVESRLRMWFEERCVQPRMQQVAVPNLWPRMKNVVEGDGGKGGVTGGRERDLREEARREVEEERRGWEGQGLRRRGGGTGEGREYGMPGAMPGMMVA
ncbi:ERMES complex subunit mmm1 [Trapelia coarctata]|nr:ERMES complex subunit mmm1 [Trapelia coarctata]